MLSFRRAFWISFLLARPCVSMFSLTMNASYQTDDDDDDDDDDASFSLSLSLFLHT